MAGTLLFGSWFRFEDSDQVPDGVMEGLRGWLYPRVTFVLHHL